MRAPALPADTSYFAGTVAVGSPVAAETEIAVPRMSFRDLAVKRQ